LKGLWILNVNKGVFIELVFDILFVELELDGVVAIEIELSTEGEVGRDFQIAWATEKGIVKVDVVLFDRLSAVIDSFIGFSRF